ncbi:MAG: type II secretion system F family protein [Pirellulaceae bacterium]
MSGVLSNETIFQDLTDDEHPLMNRYDSAPLTGRVPKARVLLALNQIAVMSSNGIDLAESIQTAANHTHHPVLADQLYRIFESIHCGQSVSFAFATYGKSFPATFAPMLAAAEATGTVPESLQRMAAMMRSDLQLRSSVSAALVYPIILISASVLVMLAVVFGVLPRFAVVFEQLGRPCPAFTQLLLDAGTFGRQHVGLCLGGLVLTVGASVVLARYPQVTLLRDRALLYMPILREAYRPLLAGRLFRLIGSMIQGGVPLLDSIRLAKRSFNNQLLLNLLQDVEADLIDGNLASRCIAKADFLPAEAGQMLATAERTGRLAEVLSDVGAFYEEEGSRELKKLVGLLEPLIILSMGVMVAGIVLSIMLPLLDVSTTH